MNENRVESESLGQLKQTAEVFRDKWIAFSDFQVGASENIDSDTLSWILNRNGFDSIETLAGYLNQKRRILDAGCGNGRITRLLAPLAPNSEIWAGDLVAADIASKNLRDFTNVRVVELDLMDRQSLGSLGKFDFIYCQEVLHHTSDPQKAFSNLAAQLTEEGEIAIYVYGKKAIIREAADDLIRRRIEGVQFDVALDQMRELALFGRTLADLGIQIAVPEVSVLDIPAGTYDLQRLIYNFILKCYWNPEFSENENAMVNFDWYAPTLCSRHSLDEVCSWFDCCGLRIVHSRQDPYGITIRGVR